MVTLQRKNKLGGNPKPGHEPISMRDMKPHTCKCGKAFARKADLRRHDLSHTQLRPFKCPWVGCSRAFNQLSGLSTHWNKHTGEKPNLCGFCPAKFSDPANRTRHRKDIHSDIVACKCQQCGIIIKRADRFYAHLREKHGIQWWSLCSEQQRAMLVHRETSMVSSSNSVPKAANDIPHQSAPRHPPSLLSPSASALAASPGDRGLYSASSMSTHRWSQTHSSVYSPEFGTDLSSPLQSSGSSDIPLDYAYQSLSPASCFTTPSPNFCFAQGVPDFSAPPQFYHRIYEDTPKLTQQPWLQGSTWNLGNDLSIDPRLLRHETI